VKAVTAYTVIAANATGQTDTATVSLATSSTNPTPATLTAVATGKLAIVPPELLKVMSVMAEPIKAI
jgi:hypothetical protein